VISSDLIASMLSVCVEKLRVFEAGIPSAHV
jgi:hypothetical protein